MSMALDTSFHILFIMTLYYKMRQILLQNATAVLLQNAIVITNWDNFITKCDSHYTFRRLLQTATVQPAIDTSN